MIDRNTDTDIKLYMTRRYITIWQRKTMKEKKMSENKIMEDRLRMTDVYFNRSQKIIKKNVGRKVGNIMKYHV